MDLDRKNKHRSLSYHLRNAYVAVAQKNYLYHAILPLYESLYLYFLFILHNFQESKIHKSTPLYIGF